MTRTETLVSGLRPETVKSMVSEAAWLLFSKFIFGQTVVLGADGKTANFYPDDVDRFIKGLEFRGSIVD